MIQTELLRLLEPLETFEGIRRGVVHLGDRLCDLSYANPYDGVADRTRAVLRAALAEDRSLALQYSPFGGQTRSRRAVADALRASHGLAWSYREVVLTPGAMAALHVALALAGRPGDEVLFPVPSWLDYPLYAHYLGLRPIPVRLRANDFALDVSALAARLSPRTCAVVLSHPANPTGRCYTPEDLAALAEALAAAQRRTGRTITLIADETHRDFVPPGPFHSPAGDWAATLIVYSFGKFHFLQGQRAGYLAVSPRHPDRATLIDDAVRWVRIMGFCAPTALMQRAIPGLLALRHDIGWLDQRRSDASVSLRAAGYEVVGADATLFLYVRTPEGAQDDFDFIRDLASAGVLALPAPVFHHRGYFRLALTASRDMLARGLAILEGAAARPLCSGS
jgi:aspartate aminotransferase